LRECMFEEEDGMWNQKMNSSTRGK